MHTQFNKIRCNLFTLSLQSQWVLCFVFSLGWILIDRCGKHFGLILSYLRDGFVTLPKSRQGIMEVLAEAKYYQIQGLIELCQRALQVSWDFWKITYKTEWLKNRFIEFVAAGFQDNQEKALCVIPVITSPKEEERLIQGCIRVRDLLQCNYYFSCISVFLLNCLTSHASSNCSTYSLS